MKDRSYHDTDSAAMPLGPPIRPTAAPAAPREIRPGIWQDPDGKLRTDVPPPAPAPMPYVDLAEAEKMLQDWRP